MNAYKETLLALSSYPNPTPDYVIDQAVAIAKRLGAGISAIVQVLDRKNLMFSYSHGEWLVDVPSMIEGVLQKSADGAVGLLGRFERMARTRGVFQEKLLKASAAYPSADLITENARLRDLTFLPAPKMIGLDELFNESVIFGSGRPVILLPAPAESGPSSYDIDRVVVAWDFGRAAARALADALPILRTAREVHVVTFAGEKKLPEGLGLKDLERHLQAHDVNAVVEEANAGAHAIGRAIDGYVRRHNADLLVMGAFGHSRMMEFVLGGATRSMLKAPPIPVFLSH